MYQSVNEWLNGCLFLWTPSSCQCMYVWKSCVNQGYLLEMKLWKCCMSDEDGSATAFVMQWRWPIKHKTRLSVMRYMVTYLQLFCYSLSPAAGTNVCWATLAEHWWVAQPRSCPAAQHGGTFCRIWSPIIQIVQSIRPCGHSTQARDLRPLDAFQTTPQWRAGQAQEGLRSAEAAWCCQVKLLMPGRTVSGVKSWAAVATSSRTFTEKRLSTTNHKTPACPPNVFLPLSRHFHLRAQRRCEPWQDRQAEWESILLRVGGETPSTVQWWGDNSLLSNSPLTMSPTPRTIHPHWLIKLGIFCPGTCIRDQCFAEHSLHFLAALLGIKVAS